MKTVKHFPLGANVQAIKGDSEANKVVFPFFAHVDFALCPKNDLNFEQKLNKLQNGLFRFERDTSQATGAAKRNT